MKLSVDWLSGTDRTRRDERQLRGFARRFNSDHRYSPVRPMFGYQWAIKDIDGVVYQSGEREDMGTHILATGTALNDAMDRVAGFTKLMAMIDAIVPARLDVAVDSDDSFLEPFEIAAKSQQLITKARAWSVIRSQDGGHTVYIGSRSSDQFLRVYNKASEQWLTGIDWTRIELESKGKAAIFAKGTIKALGMKAAVPGLIRGFCDWEAVPWRTAFEGPAIYYHSHHGQSDTRDWLLNVCAATMRKMIAAGDDAIFSDFCHKVFDNM